MRKFRYFRSILNAGEVSVPVAASPPAKLFTSPLPRNPITAIWFGSVPFAGPFPNAVPVVFQPSG